MTRTIETVAVIGAGYMGGGIAQSLASNGVDVVIADKDPALTAAAYERLLAETTSLERQGLFPAGSLERLQAHLSTADTIEAAVQHADLVEEVVFEDVAVKHAVLRQISAAARPDAIIGSNTSTIPVHVLQEAVERPERFLIVHWSNPAPFIPGVEIVSGEHTDPALVPPVKALLARAQHSGAEVADTPGFVLNRLQYALLKEATAIVEEGIATPQDVDTIVSTTFGFRLAFFGPFAIADMAGLDVYRNCFRTFEEAFGERFATPAMLTEQVQAGHHGFKTGAGFTGEHSAEEVQRVVDYRALAYSRLSQLLLELGPSGIWPAAPVEESEAGQ
ncbi:3-hydroxyacyl-CoA dehydrogenase family protein [Microlunatus panaciterrae]|uniref:L-gulonate 3-dehydrogenase n=1 Tax=Microlunatus panaciterrae TaxID=400768 RepID=A0ABS2RJZ2_9ACTN|nr:3-hydroxyacyl-CoA dehydrogenase family protein [Microlunatus panaciterrae]MBM7798817.1 3-hydroxybutyryl-CoA dehydrogenase [Microlunatus panaciterrae]